MYSKEYYIVKNNLGRNILVINELLNVDGSEEIKGEDFDIIFVDVADFSFNEISLFLQKSSPFYSRKCFMKPRFIKTPKKDILTVSSKIASISPNIFLLSSSKTT